MDTGPRLGADEQPAPAPAPKEPAGDRDGLAVVVAAVALLLALCLGSTRPATPWGQLLRACGRLRPLHPTTYIPGRLAVFDRNPDWDAASDPLRKAWVDRIQVTLAVPDRTIQRAIDPEEADLSLDSHVPQTQIATLRTDPARSRRLSVNTTGSLRFLVLGTHRRAGAIADVRVRRAEIDQRIMRDAPLVPLIWENFSFRWASRVHGWCTTPGPSAPTSPPCGWTPKAPDRGQGGRGRARTCGLVVVRDRPLVCPAGQTTDELGGQCPGDDPQLSLSTPLSTDQRRTMTTHTRRCPAAPDVVWLGYSLSWRMLRAFLPGSMIQAAQAKPMSAMPSSVLSPGRS
jgi:hypothetical protein